MVDKIFTTSQFRKGVKKLFKKHQKATLKKLNTIIKGLTEQTITTEYDNHKLNSVDVRDIHIEDDVILLYRYKDDVLTISLELNNMSNHDELSRKSKSDFVNNVAKNSREETIPYQVKTEAWDKRWSWTDSCHLEQVYKNGHTKKHFGNYSSLEDAKKAASKYIKESMNEDIEYHGCGIVISDSDVFVYKNGKRVGKFDTEEEAREYIDSLNESLKESKSSKEYKGYYIDYDFYGDGEYTVQYLGDDVVFQTEEEAKEFIDSLNESLKEELDIKVGDLISVNSLPNYVKSKKDLKSYKDDAYYKVIKIQDPYLICKVDKNVANWFNGSEDKKKIHKSNVSFVVRGNDYILNEDTVKNSDGTWSNKGDEGSHGKFKTKKQADNQRKAMFARGYKSK